MARIIDNKITQSQARQAQAPMEMDLLSVFKVLEEQMLIKAGQKNIEPNALINEIVGLLGDEA